MTREVDAVAPLTSVRDAARRMKELHTTLLPVATDTGLIGILTARDIAVRAAAEGRDPNLTPVEDIMTLGVVVCFEDQDVQEALGTMASKQITELPVLNRKRRLVGRFSVSALVLQAKARPEIGQVLRDAGNASGGSSAAGASGRPVKFAG